MATHNDQKSGELSLYEKLEIQNEVIEEYKRRTTILRILSAISLLLAIIISFIGPITSIIIWVVIYGIFIVTDDGSYLWLDHRADSSIWGNFLFYQGMIWALIVLLWI